MTENDSTLLVIRATVVFSESRRVKSQTFLRPGDIDTINSRLPDWITLLQISGGAPVWQSPRMILRFMARLERQRLMMYRLSQEIPRMEEIQEVIRERFDLDQNDEIDIRLV